MFPETRQQHVSDMALSIDLLEKINFPVLLIHGRDDRVILLQDTSYKLALALPNAQLHVSPACRHWVQIEKTKEFAGSSY
ncbi:alpha/beta fold hydrolase [Bacillus sp. OK048]|uniref:alpha/beta fold hydrolase n=1 Tax=Bacillus sp. OK048 TaxID=1882761 RepID=UPI00088EF918|nr:alpha/beta fold hydrolase [Bacillus sp. OK048]SDL97584.1 hypothetical protein SAMN05443253_101345 [Bacillus sp. OK048]